jgi:hypothetical protein
VVNRRLPINELVMTFPLMRPRLRTMETGVVIKPVLIHIREPSRGGLLAIAEQVC